MKVREKKMKEIVKFRYVLVLAGILFGLGCQPSDFGSKSSIQIPLIEGNCIVTFYEPDGSYYLTEQRHQILAADSIEISAEEPQGDFICQLSGWNFKVLAGAKQIAGSPIAMCDRFFAQAVLDIIVAPFLIGDEPADGETDERQPVKIEGQWYHRFEVENGCTQVFYKNIDTGGFDIVWLADAGEGIFLKAKAYNYTRLEGTGISVPTKIEMFRTNSQEIVQQRLVQIDYYTIKSSRKK